MARDVSVEVPGRDRLRITDHLAVDQGPVSLTSKLGKSRESGSAYALLSAFAMRNSLIDIPVGIMPEKSRDFGDSFDLEY